MNDVYDVINAVESIRNADDLAAVVNGKWVRIETWDELEGWHLCTGSSRTNVYLMRSNGTHIEHKFAYHNGIRDRNDIEGRSRNASKELVYVGSWRKLVWNRCIFK